MSDITATAQRQTRELKAATEKECIELLLDTAEVDRPWGEGQLSAAKAVVKHCGMLNTWLRRRVWTLEPGIGGGSRVYLRALAAARVFVMCVCLNYIRD